MTMNQKNNQVLSEYGVRVAPPRTLMDQPLGQTFADGGSSYNSKARSIHVSKAPGGSGKTPLSLLIKRDELKETKRKKELAIENHKRSMETQYKSFIKRMNDEYAQKCIQ